MKLFGRLLSSSKQKAVNNSLRSVYKIIRNTDAILQETNEMGWINTGSELRTVSPLNAGNTLLWNVVSISTNCSLYFNKQYCSLFPLVNYALDYINSDELVEFTPHFIRLRKRILNTQERKKFDSKN